MKVNEVFQDDPADRSPDEFSRERVKALNIEYEHLFQSIRDVVLKMIDSGTLITKDQLHKSGKGGSWQRFEQLKDFALTTEPMLISYNEHQKLAKWLETKLSRLQKICNTKTSMRQNMTSIR